MEDIVFQQDPTLASETFVLRNAQLIVVGGVGLEKERTVQLVDISPEWEHDRKRFKRSYLVPSVFAALCAFGGWKLLSRQDELWVPFFFGLLLTGFAVIFPFMMNFTPVEFCRFRDTSGNILFEIYRPSKAAYKYDEFLEALARRIEWSRHPSPAPTPAPRPAQTP
eukprot:gene60183-82342_t